MASVLGFFAAFGKEKASGVQKSLLQALVAWDPSTASEAEINEMIKELDKVTLQVGQARVSYEKEQKEAVAARANYDKHLAAAEILQKRIADGEQGLDDSLNSLVDTLESMRPDVEREEEEAKEAKEWYDDLTQVAQVTADKLKTARKVLEQASKEMARAELDRKKAEDRAERAQVMAGLKKDTSSLGVALESMQQQAAKVKAEAEAKNMKADLLTDMKKDDQNIADALKQASGDNSSKMSAADRLAALRK
jgi:hypothetical protein